MARATRTVNPLHFEDLEPHRFEDLIRQLAYTFRPWLRLDATGRLGQDDGLDIRGVEAVIDRTEFDEPTEPEADEPGEDAEASVLARIDERDWSIQVKRYRAIGAKLMRQVVRETVPDPARAPHGLIVAAACDVTAATMAAFREEVAALGIREAHLWTKAHLEDLLFQPRHDHLLFAYFGISLRVRQRSRLAAVRHGLLMKRKLLRALEGTRVGERHYASIMVRDIEDTSYPGDRKGKDLVSPPVTEWHIARVHQLQHDGLVLEVAEFDGWVKPDGTWDVLPESRQSPVPTNPFAVDDWQARTKIREECEPFINKIPEGEMSTLSSLGLINYEAILEVDPLGDEFFSGLHIYCRFGPELGPYAGIRMFQPDGVDRWKRLTGDHLRPLFREFKPQGERKRG